LALAVPCDDRRIDVYGWLVCRSRTTFAHTDCRGRGLSRRRSRKVRRRPAGGRAPPWPPAGIRRAWHSSSSTQPRTERHVQRVRNSTQHQPHVQRVRNSTQHQTHDAFRACPSPCQLLLAHTHPCMPTGAALPEPTPRSIEIHATRSTTRDSHTTTQDRPRCDHAEIHPRRHKIRRLPATAGHGRRPGAQGAGAACAGATRAPNSCP